MTTPAHENAAALLRRQQSTTARLRAGLPALLEQLESLDEPEIGDIVDLRTGSPDPPRSDPARPPPDERTGATDRQAAGGPSPSTRRSR